MDYLHEMTRYLSNTKRGIALNWCFFNWFLEVPYAQRPELLRQYFLKYYYDYTTEEITIDQKLDDEDIDYFEKNLKEVYADEIYDMALKNLSEKDFYAALCQFIYGSELEPPNIDTFWRFYACCYSTLVPYCRVDFESAYEIPKKEYRERKTKLKDPIFVIDTIILDSEVDIARKRAQAILQIVDERENEVDKVILLEEALFMMDYTSTYNKDLLEYQVNDKDLFVYSEGKVLYKFSRQGGEQKLTKGGHVDFMSGKEFLLTMLKTEPEKLVKADRAVRLFKSDIINTYISLGQILLSYIEKEPDLKKRIAIFAQATAVFDEIKDSERSNVL